MWALSIKFREQVFLLLWQDGGVRLDYSNRALFGSASGLSAPGVSLRKGGEGVLNAETVWERLRCPRRPKGGGHSRRPDTCEAAASLVAVGTARTRQKFSAVPGDQPAESGSGEGWGAGRGGILGCRTPGTLGRLLAEVVCPPPWSSARARWVPSRLQRW